MDHSVIISYRVSCCDPYREAQRAIRAKGKTLSSRKLSSFISFVRFNFNSPLTLSLQMTGNDRISVIWG